MKLIKPYVELLHQEEGLEGLLKHIEKAGRVCYKSEDKITDDSAKKFVDGLIKSGHTSVLEHGTVYLLYYFGDKIKFDTEEVVMTHQIPNGFDSLKYLHNNAYTTSDCRGIASDAHVRYPENKYSNVESFIIGKNLDRPVITGDNEKLYKSVISGIAVTTNYRVLIENGWFDDLKFITCPTQYHHKRISFRVVCDRGVLAEFTRHRKLSYSVESTRYCDYSKDKFDNQLTFIIPSWYEDAENCIKSSFESFLKYSEDEYLSMIDHQYTPQDTRQVLPMALKTEMVVTGFEDDWRHFLSLRSPKAGAKGVHPDMAVIANMIYDAINKIS